MKIYQNISNEGIRYAWIDAFRGACLIVIILLHANNTAKLSGNPTSSLLNAVLVFTDNFVLEALFFLSGVFLCKAFKKSRKDYFLSKVSTLIYPWIIWSLVIYPFYASEMNFDFSFLFNVYSGGNPAWYLAILFLIFAISWPLRKVDPLVLSFVFIILSIFVFYVPGALALVAARTLWYGSFFFMGSAAMSKLDSLQRVSITVLVIALLSSSGFLVYFDIIGVSNRLGVVNALLVPVVVLCLFVIFSKISERRINLGLEFLGSRSIVPYLIHLPAQLFLFHVAIRTPLNESSVVYYFVGSMVISLIALSLYRWTTWLYVFPRISR